MSRWTTNLLLTAIIVLVALLLGGRLTQLWKPTPAMTPPESLPFALLDDRTAPLQLRFGNTQHAMTRRSVKGSHQTALDKLCDACAEASQESAPRGAAATQAEQDLIARLGKSVPIRTIDPATRIYRLDASLPVLVAVRERSSRQVAKAAGDGVFGGRVVTWGLVAPGLEGGWNIYTFSPFRQTDEPAAEKSQPASTVERFGQVPLPTTTDHLLSITSADGAAVTAFRGREGPERWAQFFDDWLTSRDGQVVIPWQTSKHRWSARYRRNRQNEVILIDIQIRRGNTTAATTDAIPRWYGIITQSRIATTQE